MKTKVVYSIVSNSDDCYLEQLLISTYSIKLYNNNVKIILVIDEQSNEGLIGDRFNALKYVDEKIVVKTPELRKKSRSRWLKTSIRQLVKGDYLFIDTDTIITCDISDIDSVNVKIGAVLDRHLPLDKNQRGKFIKEQCINAGWLPEEKDNLYFNSGVMLVRDCEEAYQIYKQWHEIWKSSYHHGIDIDQPALGLANRKVGYAIQELDGTWNCQVLGNGLRYLYDAKIIHYYNTGSRTKLSSNPYLFSDIKLQKKIRDNGYKLTDDVEYKIMHPHKQFSEAYEILADGKMQAYYSDVFLYMFHKYKEKSFFNYIILIYVKVILYLRKLAKKILYYKASRIQMSL